MAWLVGDKFAFHQSSHGVAIDLISGYTCIYKRSSILFFYLQSRIKIFWVVNRNISIARILFIYEIRWALLDTLCNILFIKYFFHVLDLTFIFVNLIQFKIVWLGIIQNPYVLCCIVPSNIVFADLTMLMNIIICLCPYPNYSFPSICLFFEGRE